MESNEFLIPVKFDKSHILTLGRRMYKESIDLIRELVNNAYDADATEVDVQLHVNQIIVRDNGTGMDFNDLKKYFIIGSQHKKEQGRSPIFDRKFIGEMGIGKFSSLGATTKFEIVTQKGDFKGRVVFDQGEWERNLTDWNIQCNILPAIDKNESGTTITLYDIEQHFSPQEVADRLRLTVPINDKDFNVSLNGKKIQEIKILGEKLPIEIHTQFGDISGYLIKSLTSLPFTEIGVVCCVKNVMITRSLFGYEDYGHGARRITGRINADFLEYTSDRNDFIIKTSKYKEFHRVMHEEVQKILKQLKSEEDEKLIIQSRRALVKATQMLRSAFKEVPDLMKEIQVTVSKSHVEGDEGEILGYSWRPKAPKSYTHDSGNTGKERGPYKIPHINPITESKVIKKIKTDIGFDFGFVNEGENGPPSLLL